MPYQGVQDPKITRWHSKLSHQGVLVGLQELHVNKLNGWHSMCFRAFLVLLSG